MNLIYQYWNGERPQGAVAGSENMKAYARRIGAAYWCYLNEPYMAGDLARYFDLLRPLWDPAFQEFERVLFVDHDVFAVEGLEANIFDEPLADIGMCEELGMPAYRDGRTKHINGVADHVWARLIKSTWGITIPLDEQGRVRVFNSGVVMYRMAAAQKLARVFITIREYIASVRNSNLSGFYAIDQNYMDAMVHLNSVNFTEMHVEWNRQVHGKDDGSVYDERTDQTKFVHIQLSGADDRDAAWHDGIVNGKTPP